MLVCSCACVHLAVVSDMIVKLSQHNNLSLQRSDCTAVLALYFLVDAMYRWTAIVYLFMAIEWACRLTVSLVSPSPLHLQALKPVTQRRSRKDMAVCLRS